MLLGPESCRARLGSDTCMHLQGHEKEGRWAGHPKLPYVMYWEACYGMGNFQWIFNMHLEVTCCIWPQYQKSGLAGWPRVCTSTILFACEVAGRILETRILASMPPLQDRIADGLEQT